MYIYIYIYTFFRLRRRSLAKCGAFPLTRTAHNRAVSVALLKRQQLIAALVAAKKVASKVRSLSFDAHGTQ